MAANMLVATTPTTTIVKNLNSYHHHNSTPLILGHMNKPTTTITKLVLFSPSLIGKKMMDKDLIFRRRKEHQRPRSSTLCLVVKDGHRHENKSSHGSTVEDLDDSNNNNEDNDDDQKKNKKKITLEQKIARKKSERFTYLDAAVMSSLGITSMAVLAVYYRFSWQLEGGEIPYAEMVGTFALSFGAAVGMEYWARWAHRALWHASLWHMHESHHRPREGSFELNDVFAIINAVPAIALLSYGFYHKGLVPGLCFGAGLGITVFGMAYMFVHDGLVHRRFPVGPIANVPYFRRVAAAHQLHHSDKFEGVPYGLFMGPKELEEVGGLEELEKEINRRIKHSKINMS